LGGSSAAVPGGRRSRRARQQDVSPERRRGAREDQSVTYPVRLSAAVVLFLHSRRRGCSLAAEQCYEGFVSLEGAMPSKQRAEETEIPSTIMRSDKHAQRLWKKAHDSAVDTYGEGGRAHRVAYAALKHEYEKRGKTRRRV